MFAVLLRDAEGTDTFAQYGAHVGGAKLHNRIYTLNSQAYPIQSYIRQLGTINLLIGYLPWGTYVLCLCAGIRFWFLIFSDLVCRWRYMWEYSVLLSNVVKLSVMVRMVVVMSVMTSHVHNVSLDYVEKSRHKIARSALGALLAKWNTGIYGHIFHFPPYPWIANVFLKTVVIHFF